MTALADQYSGFDCTYRGLIRIGIFASSGTAAASAARSAPSPESASHPIDDIRADSDVPRGVRGWKVLRCRDVALFHLATIKPTKAELIAEWAPTQPWGPAPADPIEVIGAYRFDDPEGRVGMETHLVTAGGVLMQVPLTYRDEPLDGADDALITEMHHSVLGTRWVYDGLRDPRLVVMLAAVTMTGQGEALGMAVYDGRWYIAPSNVRIEGGGWSEERVPVDGFELESDDATASVLRNDRFELTVHRRPVAGPRPAIGLTATWAGQVGGAVVLAEIRER